MTNRTGYSLVLAVAVHLERDSVTDSWRQQFWSRWWKTGVEALWLRLPRLPNLEDVVTKLLTTIPGQRQSTATVGMILTWQECSSLSCAFFAIADATRIFFLLP